MNEMIANVVRELKGIWPAKGTVVNGYFADSFYLYKKDNKGFNTGRICSFDRFQANLRNLQNKPKFEEHPDAKCFVQDHLGQWFKNTITADVWAGKGFASWVAKTNTTESGWVSVGKGEVIGEWRDTLTVRSIAHHKADMQELEAELYKRGSHVVKPKQVNFMADPFNIINQATCETMGIVEYLSTAEVRTGEGLHSERTVTNEADLWFIRKELPPVGTECICVGSIKTRTAYIVAHHVNGRFAIWTEEGFNTGELLYGKAEYFKPLPNKRDEFIEAGCKLVKDPNQHLSAVFGQLFDSGEFFYKPKDSKNAT